MKNSKLIHNIALILIFLVFLVFANIANKQNLKPTIFINKQQSSINLKESFWTYLHMGQKRLFSSLLWIATILESDHDHYKEKDLNSWMFLRFSMMAKLEPKFLENYNFGGPYLSIIKDDIPGASTLLKSGLEIYPYNAPLLKNSFFHFYYEAGDYETSYQILGTMKQHHQLDLFMISALARIQSSEGRITDAFELIKNNYESLKESNPMVAARLRSYLYSIKTEIDLECLNSKKNEKCALVDLDGNHYRQDSDGTFFALKEWKPFRPKITQPIK